MRLLDRWLNVDCETVVGMFSTINAYYCVIKCTWCIPLTGETSIRVWQNVHVSGSYGWISLRMESATTYGNSYTQLLINETRCLLGVIDKQRILSHCFPGRIIHHKICEEVCPFSCIAKSVHCSIKANVKKWGKCLPHVFMSQSSSTNIKHENWMDVFFLSEVPIVLRVTYDWHQTSYR